MFHKVHLRLTCLCAAITICILCISAGFYLYLAEKALTENHLLSFRHDMDTLCASLEQQETLTHSYLLRLENNGPYLLYFWDNGTPLSFNFLKRHKAYSELPGLAANELERLTQPAMNEDGATASHKEFIVKATDDIYYDASAAWLKLGRTNRSAAQESRLIMLVFSPRTAFLNQLSRHRLLFLLSAVAGCVILTVFSWFFTGRLLRPIQENQRRQTQFVANASHELRTPLAVIRSCISVQPPNYQDTIQRECLRMGRLVDDMLTLTGLETHSRSLQKAPLSPDTLLISIYEETEALARERKLKLSIELPEETLPQLNADSDKLRQVLHILIQNAVSYTPSGGKVTLRAAAVQTAAHKSVLFQVIDNGPGISEEDKRHIFERFYRSDQARGSGEHFGLGLCIAKKLVQAHHGALTVGDTPGGGSTFSCCFPCSS